MSNEPPQIDLARVLDAPRELVYRTFTDPEHFVAWWGPIGSSLPLEEIEFDVRTGGYQRWTELSATDPGVRVQVRVELTAVAHAELLDGLMHVSGQLPGGVEPFITRVRVEFHDAADARTRLRIRQWLPEVLTSSAERGWSEAFTKLDAALVESQDAPSRAEVA